MSIGICGPVKPELQARADQLVASSEQLALLSRFIQEGKQVFRDHMLYLMEQNLRQGGENAWTLFHQTLILLWLHCICPTGHRISPPPLIDSVWHQFLLCTKTYAEYCERATGGFIHHTPITPSNKDQFAQLTLWLVHPALVEQFVGKGMYCSWCWQNNENNYPDADDERTSYGGCT